MIPALNIYTQTLPDYAERDLITEKDSLINNYTFEISPTEGSINPQFYFVGPGDKIFVSIRGIMEQSFNLLIDQEGNLYIPKVGLVDLNGKTLEQSKEIIKQKILDVYKEVNIQISLIDLRKIKVNLIGNVSKPSSFILYSNSRLLDLLLQSNSIKVDSDLRNIKIINKDGNKKFYDLVSFLRLGDKNYNPYLREGDVVFLSRADRTVSILGAVKNPGTFEYVEGETAEHLIQIAGGFLDKAKSDTLELTSFLSDNKSIVSNYYSYSQIKKENILLNRGDKLIVREKPEYLIDRYVDIKGYVKYPGFYKITRDKTSLHDLILNEASGFLENASLKDAYVIRNVGSDDNDPEFERLKTIPRADMTDDEYDYYKQKSRHIKGKMVVDFERLFKENDLSEDLILKRGDEIFIPEDKKYITLVGQVINPGNIIYKPDLTVNDYIKLAGGFGWRALENDIRVIKSNTGEWVDADDVTGLEPGDIIWIPENPPSPRFWDLFQNILNITGQVATVIAATVAVIIATRK